MMRKRRPLSPSRVAAHEQNAQQLLASGDNTALLKEAVSVTQLANPQTSSDAGANSKIIPMLTSNTTVQDRYRIIRQLGQGGMGTVYEALDERLDAVVALKESHFTDDHLARQFEREARLLARLRHPALTRVIDHFQGDEGQFLVMDFIPGEDLSEILRRRGGALAPREVLGWADQLLDALEYLHSQQPPVIHRDIKPQNLKLSTRNQVILLDFGLAKGFVGQMSRVTTSGSIFGYTPNYAPLEQIQGTGTDPRSDLYSLAATLYHLVTGTVPPDVLTRLTATTDGLPDPLLPASDLNEAVPVAMASILNRAMAIGRNGRFATAADMRRALSSELKSVESVVPASPPVAEQSPTIIESSPSEVKTNSTRPVQSTNLEPQPPVTLESESTVVASPADLSDPTETDSGTLFDFPTGTMLDEPIGTTDRWGVVGKLGLVVLLLIIGLIILGIASSSSSGQ